MDDAQLAAEQRARVLIDRQLTDAGWLRGEIAHVAVGSRRYISRDQMTAFIDSHTQTGATTACATATADP